MSVKVIIQLHDNLGGFQDTWIDNAYVTPGLVPTQKLVSYMIARMGFSGFQTYWDYIRISGQTPDLARQVQVYYPSDTAFAGVVNGGTFPQPGQHGPSNSDFKALAYNMRKFSPDNFSGRIYFRGIADITVDFGGLIQRTAAFTQALTTFQNAVVTNAWGWYHSSRLAGTPVTLMNVTQNADGTITITTGGSPFAGMSPTANVSVRISGQKIPGNINHVITVRPLGAPGNNAAQSIERIAILPFVLGNGKVFVYQNVFKAANRLAVVGATTHKTGIPFGESRGRSRVIVRA